MLKAVAGRAGIFPDLQNVARLTAFYVALQSCDTRHCFALQSAALTVLQQGRCHLPDQPRRL